MGQAALGGICRRAPAVPNGTGVRTARTGGGDHRARWPPARWAAPQAP